MFLVGRFEIKSLEQPIRFVFVSYAWRNCHYHIEINPLEIYIYVYIYISLSLPLSLSLSLSLSLPLSLSLSSSFPFVTGEVLPATFSPPHLIVFSTLLCLWSSSSSLPPLLPSSQTWGDSDSGVGIKRRFRLRFRRIGVGIICSSFWWSRNRGDWNRNRSRNRGDWNRSWNRNQMTIPRIYVHVPSNINSGSNLQET